MEVELEDGRPMNSMTMMDHYNMLPNDHTMLPNDHNTMLPNDHAMLPNDHNTMLPNTTAEEISLQQSLPDSLLLTQEDLEKFSEKDNASQSSSLSSNYLSSESLLEYQEMLSARSSFSHISDDESKRYHSIGINSFTNNAIQSLPICEAKGYTNSCPSSNQQLYLQSEDMEKCLADPESVENNALAVQMSNTDAHFSSVNESMKGENTAMDAIFSNKLQVQSSAIDSSIEPDKVNELICKENTKDFDRIESHLKENFPVLQDSSVRPKRGIIEVPSKSPSKNANNVANKISTVMDESKIAHEQCTDSQIQLTKTETSPAELFLSSIIDKKSPDKAVIEVHPNSEDTRGSLVAPQSSTVSLQQSDMGMNFSFAGCGFLGIYHVGVASCLRKFVPHLKIDSIAGASAGAMAAACLLSNANLGSIRTSILNSARDARSRAIGGLSPGYDVQKLLREGLDTVLPDDVHERLSGRLSVSVTRISDGQNVCISEFASREELLQVLMCSSFIPLFSGLLPLKVRGVRYMDGGFSDNLPVHDSATVTCSPFSGEADICPRDSSSGLMGFSVTNTNFQLSRRNIQRFVHALFPPSPEELNMVCQQGFDDALDFLIRSNFISCTRCSTVVSCVMQGQQEALQSLASDAAHVKQCIEGEDQKDQESERVQPVEEDNGDCFASDNKNIKEVFSEEEHLGSKFSNVDVTAEKCNYLDLASKCEQQQNQEEQYLGKFSTNINQTQEKCYNKVSSCGEENSIGVHSELEKSHQNKYSLDTNKKCHKETFNIKCSSKEIDQKIQGDERENFTAKNSILADNKLEEISATNLVTQATYLTNSKLGEFSMDSNNNGRNGEPTVSSSSTFNLLAMSAGSTPISAESSTSDGSASIGQDASQSSSIQPLLRRSNSNVVDQNLIRKISSGDLHTNFHDCDMWDQNCVNCPDCRLQMQESVMNGAAEPIRHDLVAARARAQQSTPMYLKTMTAVSYVTAPLSYSAALPFRLLASVAANVLVVPSLRGLQTFTAQATNLACRFIFRSAPVSEQEDSDTEQQQEEEQEEEQQQRRRKQTVYSAASLSPDAGADEAQHGDKERDGGENGSHSLQLTTPPPRYSRMSTGRAHSSDAGPCVFICLSLHGEGSTPVLWDTRTISRRPNSQ